MLVLCAALVCPLITKSLLCVSRFLLLVSNAPSQYNAENDLRRPMHPSENPELIRKLRAFVLYNAAQGKRDLVGSHVFN
jgi:hypothetical protein